ncbi:MAG: PfkB family carbohydrate kinase, partial [Patescibacteria group bacterium]
MDTSTAGALLERFSSIRVVVGDIMLDAYVRGDISRLNPESNAHLLDVGRIDRMTGGAGNAAKNLASLGAKTVLVGLVGNDEPGRALFAIAESEGYTPLLYRATRATVVKTRYLTGSSHLLRVDTGDTSPITRSVERHLIARLRRVLSKADGVVVSDYAKGMLTSGVLQVVMRYVRQGKRALGDMKPGSAGYVRGITMMSPNLKEGYEYLGLPPGGSGISCAEL